MKHGKYHYPGCLLKRKHLEAKSYAWKVVWWRYNNFYAAPPDPNDLVPESDIVDALWGEHEAR
jgi:hypothetical protein